MKETIFDSMRGKQTEEERLADGHWTWLQDTLEVVYKGAFLHGYKHGKAKRRVREGGKINGKETLQR